MNDRHSASSSSSIGSTNASSTILTSSGAILNPLPHFIPSSAMNYWHQLQQAIGVLHQPSNASEWQLLLVLQRANLLQYYDTFISQGGDDVQQLLEAGEEEFLEIMALVGMASKPLHVRRLQKTLQEYAVNPAAFQILAIQKGVVLPPSLTSSVSPTVSGTPLVCNGSNSSLYGSPPALHLGGRLTPAQQASYHSVQANQYLTISSTSPTLNSAAINLVVSADSSGDNNSQNNSISIWPLPHSDGYDLGLSDLDGSSGVTPTLTDAQIQRIAECAILVLRRVPDVEPKMMQNKKKISRELLAIMELPMESPLRLEEFRRYSAIYGRFDAKRKADKPLTLHEVSVNEAAAQLCLHQPALLTRRDELFPLARHVVREAGYNYVKPGRPKLDGDEVILENSSLIIRKRAPPSESADASSGNGDEFLDGSGSPAPSTSSASRSSPGGGNPLTVNLSPQASSNAGLAESGAGSNSSRPSSVSSLTSLTPSNAKRQRRRLEEIGAELQRIGGEQEDCKRRVNEAQEMSELHAIQHELQRLTQRQLELSDEQAALLTTTDGPEQQQNVKVSGPRSLGNNYHTSPLPT